MRKKIKVILIVSLVLNFLLILTDSYVISKKGGLMWIENKMDSIINRNSQSETEFSKYYYAKNSIFDTQEKYNNGIVFLGDSLTDNFDWNESFKNSNIQNRGISSDTTDGVINRLDNIISEKPKKIFLMIGINDLGNGKKNDYIINNYEIILNKIRKDSPNTIVYIQSVLPINKSLNGSGFANNTDIIDLNKKLQQLSSDNIIFINIFDSLKTDDNELNRDLTYDGTHLNGQGYKIWLNIIKDYVK